MSTATELEEQVWAALLGLNTFRLHGHTACANKDRNDLYAAFENMKTEVLKGLDGLDQLGDLLEQERLDAAQGEWIAEHDADECADSEWACPRDHDEERAESAAETAWEIERDLG